MKNLGFSTDNRALVLVAFGAAEVTGKILIAFIGDHLPFLRVNAVAISSAFGAVAAGLLTLVTSLAVMIVLSVGEYAQLTGKLPVFTSSSKPFCSGLLFLDVSADVSQLSSHK